MEDAWLHYMTFHTNASINVIPRGSGSPGIYVELSNFQETFSSKSHRRIQKCVILDQISPPWLEFEMSKAQECLQDI